MIVCCFFRTATILIVLYISGKNIVKANVKEPGCSIFLSRDIPPIEPVYLQGSHGNYQLIKPTGEEYNVHISDNITLLCPGRLNHFAHKETNLTTLVCRSGNNFKTVESGLNVDLKELNCTRISDATLKITSERCSRNKGYIYDIGFQVDQRNFLKVYQVCYNNETHTTFFAVHEINGAAIKYSVKESKRRGFQTFGLIGNTVNQLYQKKNQITHFINLFGTSQEYINNSMFLARGHLTPDADFVFSSAQLATYFYINTAPEFQIINAGNWKRVENLARELAGAYRTSFLIYTGVYEVLQLPNSLGLSFSVYLDTNNNIPVPKWFWKVIKSVRSDAAIVLVTLNNPFAKRNDIQEFCPNVCQQVGLFSIHFHDIRKGYTFCCELESFKQYVKDFPSNVVARSLLTFCDANCTLKDD